MLFDPFRHEPLRTAPWSEAHARAAIERIVRRGQEEGEFREELDPQLASVIFYGAIEEVLTGWVLGLLPDGDTRAEETVVAVVAGGLGALAADRN